MLYVTCYCKLFILNEKKKFWDAFKSAIHNDKELANVDKFKYLRSFWRSLHAVSSQDYP